MFCYMEPVKEFSHIQCIWNCACVLVSLSPTAFYLFKQKHVKINTCSLYFIIKRVEDKWIIRSTAETNNWT